MNSLATRLLITLIALCFAAINQRWQFTPASVLFVVLGFTPWLSQFLKGAELPGGWKFEFKEVKEQQEKQGKDIEYLRFLIEGFLTEEEYRHLQRLASADKFAVKCDETSSFFAIELRRLRALGLISSPPGRGIRSLFINDGSERDVREHFQITEKGREYLSFRASYSAGKIDDSTV